MLVLEFGVSLFRVLEGSITDAISSPTYKGPCPAPNNVLERGGDKERLQ